MGEGAVDLLFLGGMLSHVEVLLEEPGILRWFERLGEFSRVILMDRRGTGLSDALPAELSLQDELGDVTAVLDAVGVERFVINGYAGSAPLAVQYAAAFPGRCRAMVLYAPMARTLHAPDYDWASTAQERDERYDATIAAWGTGTNLDLLAPSVAGDQRTRAWLGRLERQSLSPGALAKMIARTSTADVRDILDRIEVPTLIVHRTDDRMIDVRHSRYLATRIPGAKLVELPGIDNLPSVGDSEAIVGEFEEFLTGGRRGGVGARDAHGAVHRRRRRDRARRAPRRRRLARAARRAPSRRPLRSSRASAGARSRRSATASS